MRETSQLIELIYEAPFAPQVWKTILQDISDIAGARGGVLSSMPVVRNGFAFSDSILPIVEAMQSDDFERGRSMEEELFKLPSAAFYPDNYVFSDEMKAELPVYKDVFWPLGIGHTAGTYIKTTLGEHLMFCLLRDREKGPTPEKDLERLTALRPHLARAVTLSTRNEFQQIQSANQALAATGLAAAAISAEGRIIDCNALFSALGHLVSFGANNRFRLLHKQANSIIGECLEKAQHRRLGEVLESRSIPLPATETGHPAILHLIPSGGMVRDLFTNVSFFIIVTPLGVARPAPIDIIESLFDLTVSEARIAQSLAMGQDVKDMASAFNISPETVRKHLKNIYSKTGISRQAELSATIAGLQTMQ